MNVAHGLVSSTSTQLIFSCSKYFKARTDQQLTIQLQFKNDCEETCFPAYQRKQKTNVFLSSHFKFLPFDIVRNILEGALDETIDEAVKGICR